MVSGFTKHAMENNMSDQQNKSFHETNTVCHVCQCYNDEGHHIYGSGFMLIEL